MSFCVLWQLSLCHFFCVCDQNHPHGTEILFVVTSKINLFPKASAMIETLLIKKQRSAFLSPLYGHRTKFCSEHSAEIRTLKLGHCPDKSFLTIYPES